MVHPDVITYHFGLTNGANLATIPFSQLREKLLKRVPNVRDIRIERRLPNRVTVEVIEREPIARIAPPTKLTRDGFTAVRETTLRGDTVAREVTPRDTTFWFVRTAVERVATLRVFSEFVVAVLARADVVRAIVARDVGRAAERDALRGNWRLIAG